MKDAIYNIKFERLDKAFPDLLGKMQVSNDECMYFINTWGTDYRWMHWHSTYEKDYKLTVLTNDDLFLEFI